MTPGPRAPLLLACLMLGWTAAGAGLAQSDDESASEHGIQLPPGLEIDFTGTLSQTEDGGVEFTGPVTMTWEDTRIQADTMRLRDKRYVEAEGNILIEWGQNRIFGSRLSYDLDEQRGIIEDTYGHVLDEYIFWAKSVEKIGDKKLLLKSGVVTTCTQPLAYWSFAVSSARITIEKYARMRNVRLKIGYVPTLYLPYLVWPVKDGRAAGLLMPEFGTTDARGNVFSQELFIPLGRSADLTLLGQYYTEAGFGAGAEARFIPTLEGQGQIGGYYIDDRVSEEGRYRFNYNQTQQFRNGFRMVADVVDVSDPTFYSDYERDLNTTSISQTLHRFEFSRNGAWGSMNARELRREQLATGLVQQSLPEVEWRGSSRRLGKTPFYLSFESSLASIQQKSSAFTADYLRADVGPVITIPYSPSAWFDITPRVSYRYTYYTQQKTFNDMTQMEELVDEPLTRQLTTYGVELVGPKFYSIFERKKSGASYKHAIETRVSYGFAENFSDADDVLVFDEVDTISGSDQSVSYALVQRLFAKRSKPDLSDVMKVPEKIVMADGTAYDPSTAFSAKAEKDPGDEEATVPVEIASFEISQARSFDENRSEADVDGDGMAETSKAGPVRFFGRYSPDPLVSMDLRGNFDILFERVSDVSLSGTLTNRHTSLRMSLVYNAGLGFDEVSDGMGGTMLVPRQSSTEGRVTAGFNLIRDKLQLKADVAYTSDPDPNAPHFPDQRYQLQYSTQCCTFLIERLTRSFAATEDRRELRLRIDLRGVGKLLSQTF